jgi:hypothetical protein
MLGSVKAPRLNTSLIGAYPWLVRERTVKCCLAMTVNNVFDYFEIVRLS